MLKKSLAGIFEQCEYSRKFPGKFPRERGGLLSVLKTERTDTGELRPLSRPALPAGESSPFASEVEIHPITTWERKTEYTWRGRSDASVGALDSDDGEELAPIKWRPRGTRSAS